VRPSYWENTIEASIETRLKIGKGKNTKRAHTSGKEGEKKTFRRRRWVPSLKTDSSTESRGWGVKTNYMGKRKHPQDSSIPFQF